MDKQNTVYNGIYGMLYMVHNMVNMYCVYIQWNIFQPKKEILIHATTQMNLEDIMLAELRQPQKDKGCMTPLKRGTQRGQIPGDRKWSGVCQGERGWGSGELVFMGTEFPCGEMRRVLETDGALNCTLNNSKFLKNCMLSIFYHNQKSLIVLI